MFVPAGFARYGGALELVDQLPEEVRCLGVKGVHKRHMVWLPYIGNVETKSKLKDGKWIRPQAAWARACNDGSMR